MIESLTSWFTPTVLFCFLNLMIGTIFITSSLKTDSKKQDQVLTRSTSLLHRVQSFNFSFPDRFSEISTQIDHSRPSLLQRVRSINLSFSRSEKPDPFPSVAHTEAYEEQVQKVDAEPQIAEEGHVESHVTRSKSATCTETPAKVPARTMLKSASEKKMPVEEEVNRWRPATTRETVSFGVDEAVDKKADDFINKFRQQLKLQRLDSIIRYKEMLNRGAGR